MPQTVEALYHDGIVELLQRPAGIFRFRALVVFLETETPEKHHAIDLAKVSRRKSTVDKWIGLIEGAEVGDWKAERKANFGNRPNVLDPVELIERIMRTKD